MPNCKLAKELTMLYYIVCMIFFIKIGILTPLWGYWKAPPYQTPTIISHLRDDP